MGALYRKYRPQSFKDLVGQNHIKITLEHEISTGRESHAYLFCGPRGIGKTTTARIIAKALNCKKRKPDEHEPCNECDSCRSITAQANVDIIEIDAASHTGVDNVRENIIAVSRIAPSFSKHKVFIIDEVHMLSASAFNALLKVLEEPPKNVVFVLCTTEVHKIPATIISRCERFDFKRMKVSDIVKRLAFIAESENIKISKPILGSIARYSEGHMRDAISMLGQVVAIGGREISQEEADLVVPRSDLNESIGLAELLNKKNARAAIEKINKLNGEGINLKKFITDTIEIFRKMMLIKIHPGLSLKIGEEMGEELENSLAGLADEVEIARILNYIEYFRTARSQISSSFISQLPVEIAIVKLCQKAAAPVNRPSAASEPKNNNEAAVRAKSESKNEKTIKETGVSLDKEALAGKWNEVLAKIKKYNHSLSFILRVCEPKSVSGRRICLAFKYRFHKDRIADRKIRSIIEKVLAEVYKTRLEVEAVIDENIRIKDRGPENSVRAGDKGIPGSGQPKNNGDEIVDNLIKTFGGKIIS